MRMHLLLAMAAVAATACAQETTAPSVAPSPSADLAVAPAVGGHHWGGRFGAFMAYRHLPANLKLTDAQRTQMRSLSTAFRTAHRTELAQLRSIGQRAMQARRSGSSRDQVRQILAEGKPIGQQLRPAMAQLRQQMTAVLTDDQRAWLAAHRPAGPWTRNGSRGAAAAPAHIGG